MLKEETTAGGGGGKGAGANTWARVCDTCRAAACTVYCRADSAYLCTTCDARVHAANRVASRHERVWVCEACERAPAAFLCKADAASLCTACDADIHSANPLARRHHRVPILPISGSSHVPPAADPVDGFLGQDDVDETIDEEDEDEAASWLLINPVKNSNNQSNGFLFGGEVDEYLDLVENYDCPDQNQFNDQYSHHHHHQAQQQQLFSVPQKSYGGDSVVPVQCGEAKAQLHHQQQHDFQLGLEFESSKAAYSYPGSISHSVSFSLLRILFCFPASPSHIFIKFSNSLRVWLSQITSISSYILNMQNSWVGNQVNSHLNKAKVMYFH